MLKTFKKMFEKTDFCKYLKEGWEQYNKNPIKMPKIKQIWIKKLITVAEWKNHYSQHSAYCFLEKEKNGIWIGFLVADIIPFNCQECTDEEILQIDNYRRAYNIRPFPNTNVLLSTSN